MRNSSNIQCLSGLTLTLCCILLAAVVAHSQTMNSIKAEEFEQKPFAKKVRWGVSFNLYWTQFRGNNLPASYFAKPSLGINIRAEYYVTSFLGLGAGFGYQQRGAGIINPDNSGGAFSHPWIVTTNGVQGDVDSTYLEKLRFNTLELPVTLLLRTPKDVVKGIRISGAAGIIYMYNIEANDVFQSIVDGFHKSTDVTGQYIRHDLGFQLSAGFDIDAGGNGAVFQLHFVYNEGVGNVFAAGQGTGTQVAYGIRFACLF